MALGKILSWVGNKLVIDFSSDAKSDLLSLKNFLGSLVYIKNSREKKIGRISDVIGSVNSPRMVVTLFPNVPENLTQEKIFIKNE